MVYTHFFSTDDLFHGKQKNGNFEIFWEGGARAQKTVKNSIFEALKVFSNCLGQCLGCSMMQ